MANDSALKVRHAVSLDGLMKTAQRIAKRLPGIEAPEIPTRHRYPEMLPLVQMESLAGFLDALDERLKDEGYAATATAADDDETPPDAPETPPANDDTKNDTSSADAALDEHEAKEATAQTVAKRPTDDEFNAAMKAADARDAKKAKRG
jgi:hypothetical protein